MTLKNKGYRARLLDQRLENFLATFGAVEIVGCMWCGKTWMADAHGNSKTTLMDTGIREIVQADNRRAFIGETPHIIDEWQEVPTLWDTARMIIDERGNEPGQFILTGSSTPAKQSVRHSGTGRIARMQLRPMSLFETGESNGAISLHGLFAGQFTEAVAHKNLDALAFSICRGGWPAALHRNSDLQQLIPQQYLDTFISTISAKEGFDEYRTRHLLISLARNIGQAVSYRTLASDSVEGNTAEKKYLLLQSQVEELLSALKNRFVIEDVLGWDAPVRSKSRVRTKPKRSFVDPSLAAALLGVDSTRLLENGQLFGLLFEELCLRDLRIYASALAQAAPEPLKYYRDSDGLEIDAIIELRDGRWAAIEIKLGENGVPVAEQNLLRLKRKVAANPLARNPEPAFMAVLLGAAEYCRQTAEGIYVIPIESLRA